MKIDFVQAILALVLSVALAYLAYLLTRQDTNSTLFAIGAIVVFYFTLLPIMATNVKDARLNKDMKVWSGSMFFIAQVVTFCFAGFGVHLPAYVVLITLQLVAHLFVLRKIAEG